MVVNARRHRAFATIDARDSRVRLDFCLGMDVVFAFADRIVVLDRGEVIASGVPDTIRADARVQAAYLAPAAGPQ